MNKTIILIPTSNEEQNIKDVIEQIEVLNLPLDIIVLDASTDRTKEIVQDLSKTYDNISISHRPFKDEFGSAYKRGFALALEKDYDFIIQMDGDRSHMPRYIPSFLREITHADVVMGSRYVKEGKTIGWPLKRKIISFVANRTAKILLRLPFNDLTTGYRCYRRKVIEKILPELEYTSYVSQVEGVLRAYDHGFKISEIPVTFVERVYGRSKLYRREYLQFLRALIEMATERRRHYISQ